MPIVPQNAATTPAKNRLEQPSAWQTPSNCRHFLDNLYQIQFSDCSALPETRLQSLPHPYSPLRASAFFRMSRNPGPGKLSISQKSFGMKLALYLLAPAEARTQSPDCALRIPVSHDRQRACLFSFLYFKLFELGVEVALNH